MIKGQIKYNLIDLKRFYLPGAVLPVVCSHCSHSFDLDLDSHYPYDFKEKGECFMSFNCPKCEESTDKEMIIEIQLKEKKS